MSTSAMTFTNLPGVAEMKGQADALYMQRASTQRILGHRLLVGLINPSHYTVPSCSLPITLPPSLFSFYALFSALLAHVHLPAPPHSLPMNIHTPPLYPIPYFFLFYSFFSLWNLHHFLNVSLLLLSHLFSSLKLPWVLTRRKHMSDLRLAGPTTIFFISFSFYNGTTLSQSLFYPTAILSLYCFKVRFFLCRNQQCSMKKKT